uniref:Uncharacterized protein n=1 Tax=viral metagenome TaxID=1070528 RepID=A0A6C0I1H5_9ZZZZ
MNKLSIINLITLILIVILMIILIAMGMSYPNAYNKNTFYGDPPGKQRAVSLQDLGNDRGWASFRCYTQQGFDIDCQKLYGHQGLSPDAMSKYQEFGEYYN